MRSRRFRWAFIGLLLAGCWLSCSQRGYDLEKIRARAEAFDREISLSWYETDNYGRPSRLAEIYRNYQDLFADPQLVLWVQRKMQNEKDLRERRRLEYLYRYLVEEFIGQRAKELDDQMLDIQSQEMLEVAGQEVAFRDVVGELFNNPDRDWRRALYRARGEVAVAKINPLLQERLKIQGETCQQFGYADYLSFQDQTRSTDFGELAELCESLLFRTELIYRQLLTETAAQVLGLSIEDIRVYDRPRLFRGQGFDEYFPEENMVSLMRTTLKEMGIDVDGQANIQLDVEDRPEKEPRPACYTISIPGDIRVLVKPMGGMEDYQSLFHEMGHAGHYANVQVEEYEFRNLGEYGITETYAFLFENLFMDMDFLEAKLEMPREVIKASLRQNLLSDLSSLRYYCGLFLYEQALHSGQEKAVRVYRNLWERARLTRMGLVEAEMSYLMANEDFYSVNYLEAWLLEAQLKEALRSEFGPRWFADPVAGQYLMRLWALGAEKSVGELARELGYDDLDAEVLRQEIESIYHQTRGARIASLMGFERREQSARGG